MMLLTVIGILTGAMLGLRYKVAALIPAMAIAAIGIAGFGVAIGDSTWTTLLTMGASTIALQLGYLAGAAFQFAVPGPHGESVSSMTTAVAQRPAR